MMSNYYLTLLLSGRYHSLLRVLHIKLERLLWNLLVHMLKFERQARRTTCIRVLEFSIYMNTVKTLWHRLKWNHVVLLHLDSLLHACSVISWNFWVTVEFFFQISYRKFVKFTTYPNSNKGVQRFFIVQLTHWGSVWGASIYFRFKTRFHTGKKSWRCFQLPISLYMLL